MTFERRPFDEDDGLDARAIANFILSNFDANKHSITNLKINKLLYFAHGFYYAKFGKPLVRNHFEAWNNGPVVHAIYECFKKHGRGVVTSRACYFDYAQQLEVEATFETLTLREREFLTRVITYYNQFTSGELVELTHRDGSPWHRAVQAQSNNSYIRNRIPNEWIRQFFVDNYGGASAN